MFSRRICVEGLIRQLLRANHLPKDLLVVRNLFFFLFSVFAMVGHRYCCAYVDPDIVRTPANDSVIVVANESNSKSVTVAQYYLHRRKIPQKNLILLKTDNDEEISWKEYCNTIHNPLLTQLFSKKWISGVPGSEKDELGRLVYEIHSHRISYIVTCLGVPLKIRAGGSGFVEQHEIVVREPYNVDNASVDSELSLIAIPHSRRIGYIDNPYFMNRKSILFHQDIIKVSRLDGPSVEMVKGLIDSAIWGEEYGLMGRAYIDIGGPYRSGNQWLESIIGRLMPMGFDMQVERSRELFDVRSRFDAPAFYFGWYRGRFSGPFTVPGFRFPPGAVAVHIHSKSAETMRSSSKNWCGPFVAHGVAATTGNVYEPYLDKTHRIDLLVDALAKGANFADASYYALPALSWQGVCIGDPLYRPFKTDLDEQLLAVQLRETSSFGQYAVIRKMRQLVDESGRAEALAFSEQYALITSGMAFDLERAKLHFANGEKGKALDILKPYNKAARIPANEWILAKEIADLLAANDCNLDALALYKTLIRNVKTTTPIIRDLLHHGILLAANTGQVGLLKQWKVQLSTIDTAFNQ